MKFPYFYMHLRDKNYQYKLSLIILFFVSLTPFLLFSSSGKDDIYDLLGSTVVK
jgi:hypothetical protein